VSPGASGKGATLPKGGADRDPSKKTRGAKSENWTEFIMDARLERYHRLVIYSNGESFGRNPRDIRTEEWKAEGYEGKPLLCVIRGRCLDCCVFQPAEVRKCVSVDCALWPYRMGTNPFSKRKGNPAAFAKAPSLARSGQTKSRHQAPREGASLV